VRAWLVHSGRNGLEAKSWATLTLHALRLWFISPHWPQGALHVWVLWPGLRQFPHSLTLCGTDTHRRIQRGG
jgi:hypothetical protein